MKAIHGALNPNRPLQAFSVGKNEMYAAYDPAGALQLANHEYGYAYFYLDDVTFYDMATLESPTYSASGVRVGTLWQRVAWMEAPGYLCVCPS